MLAGLFIVALGFSLQQTAAQPFAISLGDPSTGDSRVNLGGGDSLAEVVQGAVAGCLRLAAVEAAVRRKLAGDRRAARIAEWMGLLRARAEIRKLR